MPNLRLLPLLFTFTATLSLWSQATIRVTVLSVQVGIFQDCDGLFFGNSDFVWEFTGTDNTVGYSNNNPALFGIFGFNYAYKNNDNGPYTMSTPNGNFSPSNGLFFDHDYLCPTNVPTTINLAWEAYENDDVGNYDVLGLNDGQTNLQNVAMPVPVAAGSLFYTFTANSVDPGCNQSYTVNLRVDRIPIVVNYMQDNVCNANSLALNTTYTFGWCPGTLEPNEPAANDVQNAGSLWSKFIAPPSGSVEITSDLAGTQIGTYFQVYHAADGGNCTHGIHAVTGALIKDKFEYLSHIDFSDGVDLLGIDPEAEITLNACDPIPLISYQKLIPGETYYIQFTSDQVNDNGYFQLRVNGLGGGAPDLEDIPCLSTIVPFGTAAISSGQNSAATTTLNFGCAFDGGNNAAETGQVHSSSNPNQYHAYDYPHAAVGNPVMNESVWLNFVAPQQGRISFEADYQSALYGESAALFGYDTSFAPGVPVDYLCSNLKFIDSDEGGTNGFLGGDPSALILAPCLEPGYTYFGMVDPSDAITPLSSQSIKTWVHDPSVVDPSQNPPGNDILCLTMQNPLYQVPVIPAGVVPPFQAVAGSNVLACQEYLAGEPNVDPSPGNCANQTVWHYFVAPASGAVEISLRAYIGMNLLRFNIYELLNGSSCYGGLAPATFTTNGTRYDPVITPVVSGSATQNGQQVSMCCLDSGTVYAIQLDGGSPGDEGQYIIDYVHEIEADAGDIEVTVSNGEYSNVLLGDTILVCYGNTLQPTIMLDGIGNSTQTLPGCLSPGYVLHSYPSVPDPVYNSGFSFIDSMQSQGNFTHTGNGSGSFGNPIYNAVYYLSPAGDLPNAWGSFSCQTTTVSDGVPVVFLSPLAAASSYDNSTCTMSFTLNGGVSGYLNQPYEYVITNPLGEVVQNATIGQGQAATYVAAIQGTYTITIPDEPCPLSLSIDASGCQNPCVPVTVPVSVTICQGDSILLGGAMQSLPGTYVDSLISVMGCDSMVLSALSFHPNPSYGFQNTTLCQGDVFTFNGNEYTENGQYQDTIQSINGCDSIVTTSVFVITPVVVNQEVYLCSGSSYTFNGNTYTQEGVYFDTTATVNGCDSINVLSLFLNAAYETSIYDTVCMGTPYFFGIDTLSSSGTYVLPLVADNGCDSTVTLDLYLLDCSMLTIFAPNSFTPDADGTNDIWSPIIQNVKSYSFDIYNRWGQRIFTSTGDPWDGTYQGNKCQMGVYTYIIDWIDNDNIGHRVTGSITLVL
jgi:gliding motility-associated-like protein